MGSSAASPRDPFARAARGVVLYNLAVIVWGAYVRASGSGAGCGSHWPSCNGDVIPRAPSVKTLVEFSHRATSGLALLSTLALLVWAFRRFPRGDAVRRAAVWSNAFMLGEALLGAGLVLFELVAGNKSHARAFAMSAHLLNTFCLLGALTLTAHFAGGGKRLRLAGQGSLLALLGAGLGGMFVLGISGAVAALGDTLFPAKSLLEGMGQDLSATSHAFLRLRALHPLIAVAEALLLIACALAATQQRPSQAVRRSSLALGVGVVVQIAAGMTNLLLLAPTGMQLLHLLLADLVWIALVVVAANALAIDAPRAEVTEPVDAARVGGA